MNTRDVGLAVALAVLGYMIVRANKGIVTVGPIEHGPYLGPNGLVPYEVYKAHPELYSSPTGLTPEQEYQAIFGRRPSPVVGVATYF